MTDEDKALYLSTRTGEKDETIGSKPPSIPFYFRLYRTENHKWDNKREYLFQNLIKEGMNLKDVAQKVGISYDNAKTKLYRLKEVGFGCDDLRKKWDHEKITMLLFLKENLKHQDKDIAYAMGFTLASVKSKIKEIRYGRKQNDRKKEKQRVPLLP